MAEWWESAPLAQPKTAPVQQASATPSQDWWSAAPIVARDPNEPPSDSPMVALPPTTPEQRGEFEAPGAVATTLAQLPAGVMNTLGNIIAAPGRLGKPFQRAVSEVAPTAGGLLGDALSGMVGIGEQVRDTFVAPTPQADVVSKAMDEGRYLDAIKAAPAAIPEMTLRSIPEMALLATGPVGVGADALSYVNDIEEQRLAKGGAEDLQGLLQSSAGAAVTALLNRYGVERILDAVGKGVLGGALRGGTAEGLTEGVQNLTEYLASTYGTNEEVTTEDAAKQTALGTLLGAGPGAVLGAGAGSIHAPAPVRPAPEPAPVAPAPLALPAPPPTPVTIEGRAAPAEVQTALGDTVDVRAARRTRDAQEQAEYDAAQRRYPVPIGDVFDPPIAVNREGVATPEETRTALGNTPDVRDANLPQRNRQERAAAESDRQQAFDQQQAAEAAVGAPPAEPLFEQREAQADRSTERRTEAQERASQGGVMADALLRSGALDKLDARNPARPEGPSRVAEEPIVREPEAPVEPAPEPPAPRRTVSAQAFRSMSAEDQQIVREAGLQPSDGTTTEPSASPEGRPALDSQIENDRSQDENLSAEQNFVDDGRTQSTNDLHTPESLGQELKARLKQVGLDEAISARVVPQIITTLGGEPAIGKGRYQSARKLIEVAMGSPEKGAYDKTTHTFVINHEIIHALKDLGLFTDAEWRVLTRAALKDNATWDEAQRYKDRVTTEKLLEEAVSDMHGAWVAGRVHPQGAVARVMSRIQQFIESIRETFSKAGYKDANEIFEAIDRGDFGKRLKERTEEIQLNALPEEDMLSLDDDQLRARADAANARRTARKAGNQKAGSSTQNVGTSEETPKERNAAPRAANTEPNDAESASNADDFIEQMKPTDRNIYTRAAQKAIDTFNDKFGWRYGPLGKMPEQQRYLRDRYLALGKVGDAQDAGKAIYDALSKADAEDMRSTYDYLTTRDAKPDTINDADVRTAAVSAKELIDKLGKRLVNEGLLPQEAYEEYAGEYLPRVYLKHILGDENVKALGNGKKVSDLGYLKKRKDISEEVRRVILGEIKDPAFLAALGTSRTGRDLAIIDFIKQVSKNKKWVPENATVSWMGKQVSPFWLREEARQLRERARHMHNMDPTAAKAARAVSEKAEAHADKIIELLGGSPGGEYQQVPDSARYGAMRGLWIRKEIYNDLIGSQQFIGNDEQSFIEELLGPGGKLERANAWWKTSKVAWNPPSQVRNFITNMGLLHLTGGVPMHRIYSGELMIRAINSIIKEDKYFKIAKKYGLKQSTFSAVEMGRVRDEWIRLQKSEGGGVGRVKQMAAVLTNKASDSYQFIEMLGKIMKLRDAMQREGKSEAQAMLEAHETLFDYSLVPRSVQKARTLVLGAPFITFTYKVLPRLMQTAIKHPHRFLPYAALFGGMEALLKSNFDIDDDDYEHLRKALPAWMNERGHMAIWPYKDESGKWQPIDFGYMMPWGVFADAAAEAKAGKAIGALQSLGLFSGPVPAVISAINTNTDPFTRKEIVNPSDPPARKLASILNYMRNLMLPGFVTEYGAIPKMIDAARGKVNERTGEANASMAQAAARFFGINIYPTDVAASRANNLRAMKHELTDIKSRMRQQLRNKNLTEQDRADITKVFTKLINKQAELMRQYAKDSELNPKLTGEPLTGNVAPAEEAAPPQASAKRVPFADLLARVEQAESGGREDAVSPKGALGPMQTMPGTLKDPGYGVKPASDDADTGERRRVGTDYLKAMLKEFDNDQKLALMAYNWGPGNVKKWIANGSDKGKVPDETVDYVNKILAREVL